MPARATDSAMPEPMKPPPTIPTRSTSDMAPEPRQRALVFDFSIAVRNRRTMELRHLRTLDAIARHGSFTRAADELHLAQSALSQQIRRLEGELGIHVLRRTSRSVGVTPEGA